MNGDTKYPMPDWSQNPLEAETAALRAELAEKTAEVEAMRKELQQWCGTGLRTIAVQEEMAKQLAAEQAGRREISESIQKYYPSLGEIGDGKLISVPMTAGVAKVIAANWLPAEEGESP